MAVNSRVAVAALAVLCLLPAAAQKAQKRKDGLSERHAKWLEEEVTYIIADEERKAFLRLADEKTRDQFVDDFWAVRNPVHSSSSNPYKDEHYQRLEYANAHFGRQSNTPGWKTDMGRAWIQFGKPVSQARFIAGGQLYPCELWFYANKTGDTGLPEFFYLLFFMPGDIGEYRFYRPYLDGPMQLVRGSQFHSNKDVFDFLSTFGGDLARAAFNLIPNDPIDTQQYTVTMNSDMLVSRVQNLANDTYNVRKIRELRALHESVHSFLLTADQRPLDISSVVVTDPAGQPWIDFSLSIDVPELGEAEADGKTLRVVSGYQLKSESGEVVIEDTQERGYPAFEVTDGQKRFVPFQIANRIPLAPGKYRLELELHQRQSGRSFRGFQNIAVDPGAVAISGPLLVTSVEQVARPDGATPFQYFGAQFHPAVHRQFSYGSTLRVLFQVEAPQPVADYQMEYVVAHTQIREARRIVTDAVHASQFRGGHLLTSKALPLSEMPEGDYRLVVNVRRADNRDVILASASAPFHVLAAAAESALFFDPNGRKLAQPGVAAYIRALAALAQKQQAAALTYLRQAVEQNPANIFADADLVDLCYRLRQFSEITRLYDRLGMKPFEDSAASLSQICLSLWSEGQQQRAREVLQSARATFPADPLVMAVAKTVR